MHSCLSPSSELDGKVQFESHCTDLDESLKSETLAFTHHYSLRSCVGLVSSLAKKKNKLVVLIGIIDQFSVKLFFLMFFAL